MIVIKNNAQIEHMRDAGRIAAEAREVGGSLVREGVTTHQIDAKIKACIMSHGAQPSFLGYAGFPASACISINDQVIHGIPSDSVLNHRDIVNIDVGAFYKGYHGDCAATFPVGDISEEAAKLIEVTKQSFFKGLETALPGNRIGDIGAAVESYVRANGFSVVRDFIGHGVGEKLHEDPEVPNYGIPGHGLRLRSGMTLAIEPMVNAGTWRVKVLDDGWTVKTLDGRLSAHYENTVCISDGEPVILTAL